MRRLASLRPLLSDSAGVSLLGASVWSGMATVAKLLSGLIIVKLVAWFAGPTGMGKFGQFMSLMSLGAALAGGGIGTGITKYVAEFRNDEPKLDRLLRAGLWYAIGIACVTACAVVVFSKPLARLLLNNEHYQTLVCVLAFAQIAIAAGDYAIAVANGFMDVRRLAVIQVVTAALGAVITAALIRTFALDGALFALAASQALSIVVALPILSRAPYFKRLLVNPRFDPAMTTKLAHYSLMTLTSALMPHLVNLFVRNCLAARFGWAKVGYWQAVTNVSDAYLLFITSAMAVYYLPKLSSFSDRAQLKAELALAYRHAMPAVIMLAALVYLLRAPLTALLFSADFTGALQLYGPQLVGDIIKIASFALSYLMVAKAMTRMFLASEVIFGVSYAALVYVLTGRFGLVGASYAFAINYVLYLAFNVCMAHAYLKKI